MEKEEYKKLSIKQKLCVLQSDLEVFHHPDTDVEIAHGAADTCLVQAVLDLSACVLDLDFSIVRDFLEAYRKVPKRR